MSNDFDYESLETLEVLSELYQTLARQLTAEETIQNEDLTLLDALYEQIMPVDAKESVSVKEQIEIILNQVQTQAQFKQALEQTKGVLLDKQFFEENERTAAIMDEMKPKGITAFKQKYEPYLNETRTVGQVTSSFKGLSVEEQLKAYA